MSADVTFIFYLVIGAAVAVAIWVSDSAATGQGSWFRSVTTLWFWPLYLPVLLTRTGSHPRFDERVPRNGSQQRPAQDQMATAIIQVETELDTALHSLNGWAEAVLGSASDRFSELCAAWRQQADRIRELDGLLSSEPVDSASSDASTTATGDSVENSPAADRFTASERSRRENLVKLKLVRQQCHADLMATLAWVRQLVTMIHLARYTGEQATRAAELVQQIADAVEGLSDANSRNGGELGNRQRIKGGSEWD